MSRFDSERFEQPPDEEFICNICQGVLDRPMETPCRHVFCKVCIEKWLQVAENKSCPTCRAAVTKSRLCTALPLLANLINKLKVFCLNRANGCQALWTIETFDDNHETTCEHRMVKCKFDKCKSQIIAKNVGKHEEKCGYRPYTCRKLCGLTILYKEKNTHVCVQLLKETVEDLRKRLSAAKEEIERLKETLDNVRQCQEEVDNFINNTPSVSGSEQSQSNHEWNRLPSSDAESNASIDDFLVTSGSDRLSLLNSPDQENSRSSVSDSMVGFSEESSFSDENDRPTPTDEILILSDEDNEQRQRRRRSSSASPPRYSPRRSPPRRSPYSSPRSESSSVTDSWSRSRSPTPRRTRRSPRARSPESELRWSPRRSPSPERRRRRSSSSPDVRRRKRRRSSTSGSSSSSSSSSSSVTFRRSRKRSRRDFDSDDSVDSERQSRY